MDAAIPFFWSAREDSNLRPPHPLCDALPVCATPPPERRLLSSSSQRCKSVGAPCGFLWRGSYPVALPFLFVIAARLVFHAQQPPTGLWPLAVDEGRSEEHTSELQSLMRISYAVFCLKKKKRQNIVNEHK